MKRVTAFMLACLCLITFAACGVPQEEVDVLNETLAQAQEELKNTEKELGETITGLEEKNAALKAELDAANAQLKETQAGLDAAKEQLENTQKELDELKNGPEAQLAAIRTAYSAQDWKQVISLAKVLHTKYPGYDEDVEAQGLAAEAQKTLDEEAAKAEAEANRTVEEKVHGLIRITRLDCSRPNSAGGVGIYLYFENMHPEKTIKYLEVTVKPLNAVGDTQYCDIRNYARYTCEATGPFAPGDGLNASDNWWWGNAWYNTTITSVELVGVSIDYMDGTYVTLTSKELEYAIW